MIILKTHGTLNQSDKMRHDEEFIQGNYTNLSRNDTQIFNVFYASSCLKNPGHKFTYQGLILINEKIIHQIANEVETKELISTHQAQYYSLNACLNFMLESGYQNQKIICYGNLQGVINLINGLWEITYKKPYGKLAKITLALKENFTDIKFEWLPKKQIADVLSHKDLLP